MLFEAGLLRLVGKDQLIKVDTCSYQKLHGFGDENFYTFYRFPEGDKFAALIINNFIPERKEIAIKIYNITGEYIPPRYFVQPSFINDNSKLRIVNFHVIENDKMSDKVILVATASVGWPSNSSLFFCTQLLDKKSNFKPIISESPYCQEMPNIRQVTDIFALQQASRQKWMGYLSLFEYSTEVGFNSRRVLPVPTPLTFKLDARSLSKPPLMIEKNWVSHDAAAFVVSSRRTANYFTSFWPDNGLKYRTYRLNPVFVEGTNFSARTGLQKNITVFQYPSELGMKFNFIFLGSSKNPNINSNDCKNLPIHDLTCDFDLRQGKITVLSQSPTTLFFNASACIRDQDQYCASAKIRIEIVGTNEGSSMTLVYIGIGTAICISGTSIICCLGLGTLLLKKYNIIKSHHYDDNELSLLWDNDEQKKYDKLEEGERPSKLESVLEEGENYLELNEIDKAKQCFLQVLTLEREHTLARSFLSKVIQKEKKRDLNKEGIRQGLFGDSFLQNYKINLNSIEFVKNKKGRKKILGEGSFGRGFSLKRFDIFCGII
jgi:hypothetical protein